MVGNEPTSPVIVCDAGPLIHLDEVGCVELLADFPRALVPLAVWDEVVKHRPGALAHSTVRFQKVTPGKVLSTELDVLSRLLGLHRGEQEALQERGRICSWLFMGGKGRLFFSQAAGR